MSFLANVPASEELRDGRPAPNLDGHHVLVDQRLSKVTRRGLEISLGALWVVDGFLQLQPYMFTKDFFLNVLGMASMGTFKLYAELNNQLVRFLLPHFQWFNALFAITQIMIGIGLIWKRSSKAALIASFTWGIAVWLIGEGAGGMFMPGMSMFNGAPGAVLLYAILSIILFPTKKHEGRSIAEMSWLGERGVLVLWIAIWAGTSLLELQQTNNAPRALSAVLKYQGHIEPGLVSQMDKVASSLVGMYGTLVVFLFMLLQVTIGF